MDKYFPISNIRNAALAILINLYGFVLYGDTDDVLPTLELPPYVVVATRTPLPLEQVSPSVSYISGLEMEQNQDRSLIDVLRRQPGMVLNSNGARGSLTGLFTRGTESNHTGFFLDGRRLNPAFSNQFDLEFLSLDNLSSVQIQRGPSSVNFGSSGIGGVISLQTRSGLGEKTSSVAAEAEYGSYDYYRGAFNASIADEDWAFSLGTSGLTTENKRNNDKFDNFSANSRVEYKLTEHLVAELVSLIIDTDNETPGLVGLFSSNTDFSKAQSWLISPGVRFASTDWTGKIFYSSSKQFSEGIVFSEFKRSVRSDEVYAQVDYSGVEGTLFSIGGLYRNDEIRDNGSFFLDNLGQAGLWTQIQWQPINNFEVRLGGRFDEYTDFRNSANGSIELLYSIDDLGTTVFAKLANSYAPPSAQDLSLDGDLRDGVTVNTELNPEESESYEIGIRQSAFEETLNVSLVFFRNEIEELIDSVFLQTDFNDPSTKVSDDIFNLQHATTEGIEFALNYEPVEKLNLSCAYTYLEAINHDEDERLLRRPRHTLQLGANYQFTNALFAGIRGNGYFDRKDTNGSSVEHEDYFVVDLFADYRISESLTIFGRVENLLDEEYEPVLGYPALEASGYVGARLSF